MNALQVLSILLSLYRPPANIGERITNHQEQIISMSDAAASHWSVPVEILLTVAYLETHLGADGESDWGSPVDRRHRHTAGTADDAARDLAHSFTACGDWLGALHRYRVGLCNGHESVGYTAQQVLHIVGRIRKVWAVTGVEQAHE